MLQPISPINRIPNELLVIILTYTCTKNSIIDPKRRYSMHVSAVCSLWRELALSYPTLWSQFEVFLGGDPEDSDYESDADDPPQAKARINTFYRQLECILDIYLERSKQELLSVRIDASLIWVNGEHPVFAKLARSSFRWKSVDFSVYLLLPHLYPSLKELQLPELETTSIFQEGDEEQGALSIFAHAPKLRCLEIGFGGFSLEPTVLNSITKLECCPDSDDFYHMLEMCPNLQHLTILDIPLSREDQNLISDPPRKLSILSLKVSATRLSSQPKLFQATLLSFIAPSLTALTIGLNEYGLLNGILMTDVDVVNLLECVPSVQELTIRDPPLIGKILKHSPPVSKHLCHSLNPNLSDKNIPILLCLRSLTLKSRSKNFDSEEFISTVRSRWLPDVDAASKVGIQCLRSIELYFRHPFQGTDYLPLNLIEESGMRVVVKLESEEMRFFEIDSEEEDVNSDAEEENSYEDGSTSELGTRRLLFHYEESGLYVSHSAERNKE
ncbi:hypothetical protein LENED_001039 [Lentinula edodes]|uniref:Uncharacterized protein n=1 Tax=Lentinula edodes TaxID=5353 RepID=A0A1Q3DXC7_LENED|nr:hypothetical protein LENED_001039 [Lentinula edodes]